MTGSATRRRGQPGRLGRATPAAARPKACPSGSPGQSAWPDQPPARTDSPGRRSRQYQGGGSGRAYRGGGGGRRWLRPRRILGIVGLLVVLVLVFTGAMYFYLDSKLTRVNVLVDYAAARPRPPGRTG